MSVHVRNHYERLKIKQSNNKESTQNKMVAFKKPQQDQSFSKKRQPKTKISPFLVDLAKDVARVERDRKFRLKESSSERLKSSQQIEARNSVALRSQQERNEVEALRKHKRKIMEEEKRVKALIEIEKTNGHRKEDRQSAQRAEFKRRHIKLEARLKKNREDIEERRQEKIINLLAKLKIPRDGKTIQLE